MMTSPHTIRWAKRLSVSLLLTTSVLILPACQPSLSTSIPPNTTFTRLDGSSFTAKDLQGKAHIVTFWATSCSTCIKEMPIFSNSYTKYKTNGLELIAVAMSYDPPMYVINFQKTRQLPFTVVMDSDDSIAKAYGDIKVTPTTFVYGKNGQLIRRYVGEIKPDDLNQTIEKALGT